MQRLFDSVKEKLADPTTFVVLMIDGVQSLTSARKNASFDEVARNYNQHSFSSKNLNLHLPEY